MHILEIKQIGIGSAFCLFGGIFLIFGLIFGLLLGLFGIPEITSSPACPFLKNIPFLITFTGSLQLGLLTGLLFGVIYGLAGGLMYAIFALVYNIFATILGGIKLKVKEND